MKPWVPYAIAAGAAALLLGGGAATYAVYTYGGLPIRLGVDRDPKKLLPGFAKKIETLMQRMRARGFEPELWEGRRSASRAKALSVVGTGVADSMHIYGAAVDIVDKNKLWNASPAFWAALGEEAERLGLTWGGRWTKVDKPHVQAIAVSKQNAFRAMTDAQRAAAVLSGLQRLAFAV
jgi:hypothetical protein